MGYFEFRLCQNDEPMKKIDQVLNNIYKFHKTSAFLFVYYSTGMFK